jgi:hypothetical protein
MAEQDSREGARREQARREQARRDHERRSDFKSKLVSSFMTPIAAAAASAAAGYAARRAPAYVERKILPKLKSLAGEAGDATHDLPARAKSVASGAGDVAQELTDKAKSLVGSNGPRRSIRSSAEIARRQEQRAKARVERRKARK